jgi:hypothetical protein
MRLIPYLSGHGRLKAVLSAGRAERKGKKMRAIKNELELLKERASQIQERIPKGKLFKEVSLVEQELQKELWLIGYRINALKNVLKKIAQKGEVKQ